MKKFRTLLASIALAAIIASPALATTSSINPTQPAQNAPLLSATIRALALAAYNDITAIFGDLTVTANQFLGSTAGGQVVGITIPNCPAGVGYVSAGGFICASGSGITALSGDGTATGPGSVSFALNNTATARTNIGLGLASTPGFSGLSLSGVENINLNSGSLLAALTGSAVHTANANATISRYQLDAFANPSHFSAVRYDGTAAAPTTIQSSDILGSFNAWGYDGTTLGAGGSYQVSATQAWTPSAHGSNASIWTTPNGTTTPIQQVIVGNDGGVTVGAPAGGDQGVGSVNVQSLFVGGVAVSPSSGSISLGSITTANPHISADVTSGFYTSGAAKVDVGISGVNVAEWGTGGTVLSGTTSVNNLSVSGAFSAPSYVPTSSTLPTDGLYLPAANTSGIADRSLPVVKFTNPASAVNFLTLTGAATGVAPTITVAGGDTNGVGLGLQILGGAATATGAGGPLTITGGVGNAGTGGAITITGGTTGTSFNGGALSITGGGTGTGTAGSLTLSGGSATGNGFGASTTITAGTATTALGTVTIVGATGGGPVNIGGGSVVANATNNGTVTITGTTPSGTGPGAGVTITAGAGHGSTQNGSNLTLNSGLATAGGTSGLINLHGDIEFTGVAPAISSCGSGTIVTGSTDHKGQITGVTTATACTITFSQALGTAPVCFISGSAALAAPVITSISTAAVTFGMTSYTGTIYYLCI